MLTRGHGGQHTSSLFIENKRPVFIISPTVHKKQANEISDTAALIFSVNTCNGKEKFALVWCLQNKCHWPQTGAVSEQHVQVALQWVLIEGAAQPRTTAAELCGDLMQRVEPLELVAVQVLLDVKPEGQLWPCRGGGKKIIWDQKLKQCVGRECGKQQQKSAGKNLKLLKWTWLRFKFVLTQPSVFQSHVYAVVCILCVIKYYI